jgi:PQQ-like domain
MNATMIAYIIGFAICGVTGIFMATSKLSKRTTTVIAVLLGLTGISVIVLLPFLIVPRITPAFAVSQIVFFDGSQGNRLFVFNTGGATDRESSLRLSVLNAETGEVINKEILGFTFSADKDNTDLLAIANDKIWFSDYDRGVHARDPLTGKLLIEQKEILEKYPQLKGNVKTDVKTDDGYVFQVKPPNFKLTIESFPVSPANGKDTTYYPFRITYVDDADEAYFDGKKALILKNDDKDDTEVKKLMRLGSIAEGTKDHWLNESLNLRQGFFIINSGFPEPKYSGRSYQIDNAGFTNPIGLLIGHREMGETRERKFVASRIDLTTGKILWEIKQEMLGGEPSLYYTHNKTLYMTIEGKVVAVDPATGKVKWETPL